MAFYKHGYKHFMTRNHPKKPSKGVAKPAQKLAYLEAWVAGLRDEREIMTYVIKGVPSLNPKAN